MRIDSTSGTAAGTTSPATGNATATAATSAIASSSVVTAIDPATGQPKLPNYPWITRLSIELEQSARRDKASPFKPAEVAGETLNKLV